MFGKGNKSKASSTKTMIRGVNAADMKGRGSQEKSAPMHKGSPLTVDLETFAERLTDERTNYYRIRQGKI